jgi:sterol 24-C-methyltransferase
LTRCEHFIAMKLGLASGQQCLDVGCGVGGPLKCIATISNADVVGVNNNAHQVDLFNAEIGDAKHLRPGQCSMIKADFMQLPDTLANSDAAFAIESMPHSPDKTKSFRQVFERLKSGGKFLIYDWCITPLYDASNPEHVRIKEGIEVGNALPVLTTFGETTDAMKDAGFEVLEAWDVQAVAKDVGQVPWYATLLGSWSLRGFRMTPLGRKCTHALVQTMETLGIAPVGSIKVSALLNAAADDLVAGGLAGIFTPTYCVIARKP